MVALSAAKMRNCLSAGEFFAFFERDSLGESKYHAEWFYRARERAFFASFLPTGVKRMGQPRLERRRVAADKSRTYL